MPHRNAPLTETGRLRLARCVVDDGWPLRIDAAGVTVPGQPTVPWRDLTRAQVVRRRAVAFVPRQSDTLLPLVPTGEKVFNPRRRRAKLTKRFGSPMVVLPRLYGVRVVELVDAIRAYSGTVPVFE